MKKYSIDYTMQDSAALTYPNSYYKPTKLYVRLTGISINELKELSTLYAYGQNVVPLNEAIPAYKNIIKFTDNGALWALYGNETVANLVNRLKKIISKSC